MSAVKILNALYELWAEENEMQVDVEVIREEGNG